MARPRAAVSGFAMIARRRWVRHVASKSSYQLNPHGPPRNEPDAASHRASQQEDCLAVVAGRRSIRQCWWRSSRWAPGWRHESFAVRQEGPRAAPGGCVIALGARLCEPDGPKRFAIATVARDGKCADQNPERGAAVASAERRTSARWTASKRRPRPCAVLRSRAGLASESAHPFAS